jgi:hypothetical protein
MVVQATVACDCPCSKCSGLEVDEELIFPMSLIETSMNFKESLNKYEIDDEEVDETFTFTYADPIIEENKNKNKAKSNPIPIPTNKCTCLKH